MLLRRQGGRLPLRKNHPRHLRWQLQLAAAAAVAAAAAAAAAAPAVAAAAAAAAPTFVSGTAAALAQICAPPAVEEQLAHSQAHPDRHLLLLQ